MLLATNAPIDWEGDYLSPKGAVPWAIPQYPQHPESDLRQHKLESGDQYQLLLRSRSSTGFDHKVTGDWEARSFRRTKREEPMQEAKSERKVGKGR